MGSIVNQEGNMGNIYCRRIISFIFYFLEYHCLQKEKKNKTKTDG